MIRSRCSPLGRSWNATAVEQAAGYPCDTYLPQPQRRLTRAIDIAAPASVAYRWFCAPYSYDLLDNGGRRSPRTLTPGAEKLAVGQPFLVFTITGYEPGRHISGTARPPFTHLYGPLAVSYTVKPRSPRSCRVVVRLNIATASRVQRARATALAIGDLIMMRKQLLTLKALAEAIATLGTAETA